MTIFLVGNLDANDLFTSSFLLLNDRPWLIVYHNLFCTTNCFVPQSIRFVQDLDGIKLACTKFRAIFDMYSNLIMRSVQIQDRKLEEKK